MTARANITGVSAALVLSVLCAHQAQGDCGFPCSATSWCD